jgi:hypothetical protein
MEGRKSFLLRIDPKLWRELEAWAADELRSVNGQIEYVLRDAVLKRRQARLPEPPPEDGSAPSPPA